MRKMLQLLLLILHLFSAVSAKNDFLFLHEKHLEQLSQVLDDVTKPCRLQLSLYLDGLKQHDLWALKMFDSTAKAPSGVLHESVFHLGNFDECILTKHKNLRGKYCLGSIDATLLKKYEMPYNLTSLELLDGILDLDGVQRVYYGVCMPNMCTTRDSSRVYSSLKFDDKYCQDINTHKEYSSGFVTTMYYFGLLFAVISMSTLYECFVNSKNARPYTKFLCAFSCISNSKNFAKFPKSNLECLGGIKVFSAIGIMVFHEAFEIKFVSPLNNHGYYKFYSGAPSLAFTFGNLSIDSFLLIGGLLLTYNVLTSGVKVNMVVLLVHKSLRLAPALAAALVFEIFVLPELASGPLRNTLQNQMKTTCKEQWWSIILFAQNIAYKSKWCLTPSWYTQTDMQLFLVAPFIATCLRTQPKNTLKLIVLLIIASFGVALFAAYQQNIKCYCLMNFADTFNLLANYHGEFYIRYSSSFIGIVFGYILYQIKKGHMKKETFLKYSTAFLLALYAIYAVTYTKLMSIENSYKWFFAFNHSLMRYLWCSTLGVFILACSLGYCGIINSFLSCTVLQCISKLTLAAVFFQDSVSKVFFASQRTEVYLDSFTFFVWFCGHAVLGLLWSFVVNMAFEQPIWALEKLAITKFVKNVELKSS